MFVDSWCQRIVSYRSCGLLLFLFACDRPEYRPEWASVDVDLKAEWNLTGVRVIDPASVPEATTVVWFESQSRSVDQLSSTVADIAFDGDNLLAILDQDRMRLILVEAASTDRAPTVADLRSFGEGGRFVGVAPTSLEVLSDGAGVEVVDIAAWWRATFSSDGEFTSARRVPQPPLFGQRYEVRVTSGGDLFQLGYDRFQESLQQALGERSRGQVVGQNTLQRLSRDRYAAWIDLREVPGLEVFADQSTTTIRDLPFASRPLWGVDAEEGLWFAWSRSGLIVALNPDGSVRCALDLRIDPVGISDREASDFYQAVDLPDGQAERADQVRRNREHIPFPPDRPLLSSLTTGPDHGVLVVWEGMLDERPVARALRLTRDCAAQYQFNIRTGFRPYRSGTDWVVGAYEDGSGFDRVLLLSVRGF